MIRVIDKRATGKTGRLLLLAKETGATLVCSNPNAMAGKALAYGIVGINFVSYGDYLKKKHNSQDKYLIDELEDFMRIAYSEEIIGYTLSNED